MIDSVGAWLVAARRRSEDQVSRISGRKQLDQAMRDVCAMRRELEALRSTLESQATSSVATSTRVEQVDERVATVHDIAERINKRINKLHRDLTRPKSLIHNEPEIEFLEMSREVMQHGTTGLGPDRLYVLWQAAKNTQHLAGACAEVGVYRGGSAYFIASAVQHFGGKDPEVHVIDTFEGHPADRLTARDMFQPAGKFSDTSYEAVHTYLARFTNLEVHPGEFSQVATTLADRAYRLVHIDTDLYQPTLDCLRYFGSRLEKDGIVVIDDYGAEKCQPVVDAVRKYAAEDSAWTVWDMATEQLIMVRR